MMLFIFLQRVKLFFKMPCLWNIAFCFGRKNLALILLNVFVDCFHWFVALSLSFQLSYNKSNNIKPASIKKAIKEALDEDVYVSNKKLDKLTLVSNIKKQFPKVKSDNVVSVIKELEKIMFNHAKDLEFEKAAKLRDQIETLQANFLDMPNKNKRSKR